MPVRKRKFDVLGLGTVAVDELIVAAEYPAPDSKVRVLHSERQCGGLTAIALIAASRLGAKCAYAGMLGNDELSDFAVGELKVERVNLKFVRRKENFPPVRSFIVIDRARHTRNVFSHRAVEYRLPASWPPQQLIESSGVLFVDHSGLPAMIRAARIAAKAGIPIVADLERVSGKRFPELLALVDHLILSRRSAELFTGRTTAAEIIGSLWTNKRKVVAITYGKEGCWFRSSEGEGRIQHQPAFEVDCVDTTGCGDVFHGAYAAALAKELSAGERIRFSSAAAALKTRKLGAQAGIPSVAEVERFLRRVQK